MNFLKQQKLFNMNTFKKKKDNRKKTGSSSDEETKSTGLDTYTMKSPQFNWQTQQS